MTLFSHSSYFYLFIVLVFIAMRIPYIGVVLRLFNTLIHESSHAIVAILTSGKILKIELNSNTSGSALTVSKNKISMFFIALAGYPMAAGFGYLFFYCLQQGWEYNVLIGVLVLTSFVFLAYVRNSFGIIWSIFLIGILGYVLWLDLMILNRYFVFIFSVILSLEAVYSSLALMLIAVEKPEDAGDARILHGITLLPTLLWALLFVVINGWIVYKICVDFIILSV